MVVIDRFEYKFAKWLAGYHSYLTLNQHSEIVSFANKFAAEEFGIRQLEEARHLIKEICNGEDKLKELLTLLSDENNGWYIVER